MTDDRHTSAVPLTEAKDIFNGLDGLTDEELARRHERAVPLMREVQSFVPWIDRKDVEIVVAAVLSADPAVLAAAMGAEVHHVSTLPLTIAASRSPRDVIVLPSREMSCDE